MRRARAGDPGRLWIVARQQSAGRGRLSRPWVSPPGNLYASLLLRSEFEPAHAAELGFVTGLALLEAIAPFMPAPENVRLKWPNDLLVGDAKVAGILLEATTLVDGTFACVIGCGVNCTTHPKDTPYPAADLQSLGCAVDASLVLERLADTFAGRLARWQQSGGFQDVRKDWIKHAYRIGETISVAQGGQQISGIFRSIDATGRLILVQGDKETIIDTGNVMLPAARHSPRKAG